MWKWRVCKPSAVYPVSYTHLDVYKRQPIITAEGNNKTITLSNNTACFLPKGTYQYTIRTKGYETITGTVTVDAEAQVITKTLAKMVTWDGSFTLEPARDEDGTYLISNGPEMAWFAAKVNEECQGHSGSTINGKLIDNINLGNFDWTPIGAAILQTGSTYTVSYTHLDVYKRQRLQCGKYRSGRLQNSCA